MVSWDMRYRLDAERGGGVDRAMQPSWLRREIGVSFMAAALLTPAFAKKEDPLERMTPVLMTALAAGVALVPLLIDPSSPGKEILHPVAVTIFGGLVSATLLDAVLTPLLFLRYGERPLNRIRNEQRQATEGTAAPLQAY